MTGGYTSAAGRAQSGAQSDRQDTGAFDPPRVRRA